MQNDIISRLSVSNVVEKGIRQNLRLTGIMLVFGAVLIAMNIVLEIRRYYEWSNSPEPEGWYFFTMKYLVPLTYILIWSLYLVGLVFFYNGWKNQRIAFETGEQLLFEKGFNQLGTGSKIAIAEISISFLLSGFYFFEPFFSG